MKSLLATVLVSSSLVGCGVAADDAGASNESMLTSEPDVVRGCARFGADARDTLCLDRSAGYERVTLLRAGHAELDHAPATRTMRTVHSGEIASSKLFSSSRGWDEITYRTAGETLTVYVGTDHGQRWPVVVRAFGQESEAFPENVPYSDVPGLKGCVDLEKRFVFGPPTAGTLCAENIDGDTSVVTLRVGTNTILDNVTMSRRAIVGPPEADCIDPIPLAHICRPVTAKRTVEYSDPAASVSIVSYVSEWGFDVNVTIANQRFVLRPTFTP